MVVEDIHFATLIHAKLEECIAAKVPVCTEKMLSEYKAKMSHLWAYGDYRSDEKAQIRGANVLRSLTTLSSEENSETASFLQNKQADDFVSLQEAIKYICVKTELNPGSDCIIDRTKIQTILTTDVNNLLKEDVMTMLGLLRDSKGLVADEEQNKEGGLVHTIRKHFKGGALADVPEDILNSEKLLEHKHASMMLWSLNLALRVVVLNEVNKQAPTAIEQTKKGPQVEMLVKELSQGLNNLPRVSVIMAIHQMPMPLNEAKELLAQEIAKMLNQDALGRPKDFWLMWTIKNKEKMNDKELFRAPSLHELKRASITFKRFFTNQAINKTDN